MSVQTSRLSVPRQANFDFSVGNGPDACSSPIKARQSRGALMPTALTHARTRHQTKKGRSRDRPRLKKVAEKHEIVQTFVYPTELVYSQRNSQLFSDFYCYHHEYDRIARWLRRKQERNEEPEKGGQHREAHQAEQLSYHCTSPSSALTKTGGDEADVPRDVVEELCGEASTAEGRPFFKPLLPWYRRDHSFETAYDPIPLSPDILAAPSTNDSSSRCPRWWRALRQLLACLKLRGHSKRDRKS